MYEKETPFDTPHNSEPTRADVCGPYISFRTRPAGSGDWTVLEGLYPLNAFGESDPHASGAFGRWETLATFSCAEFANEVMQRKFDTLMGR